MEGLIEEIRSAYATIGIRVELPVTYGTYYQLACGRCGAFLGVVGDKLLPGQIRTILGEQLDLYTAGLLGCPCGYQKEQVKAVDPGQFLSAAVPDH